MKTIVLFLLLVFLTSCPSMNWFRIERLTENYVVTWGDYYDNGDIGYTLSSDLCSEKRIQDIKNVRWNNQILVVEKNNKEESRWYTVMIIDSLEYCFGDSVIGPINKMQVDSILKINRISNLEEKIFIK